MSRTAPLSTRLAGTALALGLLGLVGPGSAQIAQYPYTDLTAAFPAGGCRGTRANVTLTGRSLAELHSVRVSGPGVKVLSATQKSPTAITAELEIAPDAPLGRRSLRVVSRGGVSDPAWFQVGRLPETVETEPNSSPGEARLLDLPVVVNGKLGTAADLDCFRFRARAGETVTLALEGQSLDSQTSKLGFLDTTLTVYNASGRVVARNEDFHTLDPFLSFKAEVGGEYVAEVSEAGYGGGEAAVYRLTLGSVPWATSLYPAGGRRGTSVSVTLTGAHLPDGGTAAIQIPSTAGEVLEVAPRPDLANARPFVTGELPELLESEPNDEPARANVTPLPQVCNGRLVQAGDVDAFQVRLRRDEAVRVDVLAGRVLHSPVDLTLTVLGPNGKELASNDDGIYTFEVSNNREDSLSGDPQLDFKAPADGVYTLLIRDVAGRGGADCVYRMTVEPLTPRFTLQTFYDNPVIPGAGATGALPVQITRYGGFSGPVRLRVVGLPDGFEGSEAVIPARSEPWGTPALLTITAPAGATAGVIAPFQIEGEAEVGGQRVVVSATAMAHLSQAGDHPIRRPSDGCVAGVVAPEDYRLRTDVREISGAPGERVPIRITLERLPSFTGEISLLPLRGTGKSFQVATLGPPQPTVEEGGRMVFPLFIPKDTPPGEYSFVLCRPLAGDFRSCVPTTCSRLIRLTVTPVKPGTGGGR